MAIISSLNKNRFKIYEGGSKDVFQLNEDESSLIIFFKDQINYKDQNYEISGKGVLNNSISTFMMEKIDLVGIENHLIEKINMREQLVQILDIIPVQVKITNVAVDNYVTLFGVQEGYLFDKPMIEFRVKNKNAGNPVINESQMIGFHWVRDEEIKIMKKLAIRTNDFLSGYFAASGFRLIECNLEFGRVFTGEEFIFMLADEITPESCKLWDIDTNQKYDIETIINSDQPISVYKEIAKRLRINS